jgi:hypothetical protein
VTKGEDDIQVALVLYSTLEQLDYVGQISNVLGRVSSMQLFLHANTTPGDDPIIPIQAPSLSPKESIGVTNSRHRDSLSISPADSGFAAGPRRAESRSSGSALNLNL